MNRRLFYQRLPKYYRKKHLILNLSTDFGLAFAVSKNLIKILFDLPNIIFAVFREIDTDESDISGCKKYNRYKKLDRSFN
jgi:hypothetical protein